MTVVTAASGTFEHFLDILGRGDGDLPPAARHGAVHARYGEWFDASGQAHSAFMTRDDWVRNQIDMAQCLDRLLTEDDLVVVAVPYELSFLGAEVERAIELVGAAVIGVGTSTTICPMPRILDLIRQYEVTVLMCSPTLAAQLATLAISEGGYPEESSVRLIISIGEACSAKRLDRIAAAWGATASTLYGTQLTPVVATPCERGSLHVCDHRLRAAVRGVSGTQAAHSEAVRGELVLACLPEAAPDGNSAGTGQLVELRSADSGCACGRRGAVLTPLGPLAETVEGASGLVSVVDVEQIVFGFADFALQFEAEARAGGFTATCTVLDGSLAGDGQLRQMVEDRARAALDVDVDLDIVAVKDWDGLTS